MVILSTLMTLPLPMIFSAFRASFALLLSSLAMINAQQSRDVDCLRSIKESLQDPFGHLTKSWDFDNKTEGSICIFKGVECWTSGANRVLNISLPKLNLKGEFPRGIRNCTSLTGLDLSENQLFGPIPSDISTLIPYVTSLDLSGNNFSGEIPAAIADCKYLNVLRLDGNQLTGRIPESIGSLERIKMFSVANNELSGSVPRFEAAGRNFTRDSYANNTELCGHPLAACKADKSSCEPECWKMLVCGYLVGWPIFTSIVFLVSMHGSSHRLNPPSFGKDDRNLLADEKAVGVGGKGQNGKGTSLDWGRTVEGESRFALRWCEQSRSSKISSSHDFL